MPRRTQEKSTKALFALGLQRYTRFLQFELVCDLGGRSLRSLRLKAFRPGVSQTRSYTLE
jgi:hypothetical protein